MIVWLLQNEAVRFIIVGAVNTALCYVIFLIIVYGAGWPPQIGNAIGYGVAVAVAYYLYRAWVFAPAARSAPSSNTGKFLGAFSIAFVINQIVLAGALLLFDPFIAQIFAMTAYTVIFFMLNKYFVFR